MKKLRAITTIIPLLLLGINTTLHAEPLLAVATLFLAGQISTTDSSQADDRQPPSWQAFLSGTERQTLHQMRHDLAIQSCLELANRKNHPVAQYHLRKLAQFGHTLASDAREGSIRPLDNYAYQRPARAFNWCQKQAGISSGSKPAALATARQIARLALLHQRETRMAMLSQPTGVE